MVKQNWFLQFKDVIGVSLVLAKANFKMRVEGSYLGVVWYLLDPLLMFAVLFLIFKNNLGNEIVYFPIYLILGLIIFNFFSTVTTNAAGSIANNAVFIKSIRIKPEIFVISSVIQTVYSHIFEILIFIIFLIYYGIPLIYLLVYPIIFFFFFLMVLGIAFLLATVGVYAADLNNIWRFVTQLLFFASAIFYAVKDISWIFAINPLFYYIKITRDIIIYQQLPEPWVLVVAWLYSIFILFFGYWFFKQNQNNFAENL